VTLLAFAFGAGALATVNPCGFAVLPAFLAYYLGDEDQTDVGGDGLSRVGQGFVVGLAVSGGFAAVFTIAGLLVSLGLRSLVGAVPWAAVVIGAALVVAGLAMLAGRRVALNLAKHVGPGTGRSWRRMFVFGAGYAVASLSCTLAVLLAVVAQALATSNPLQMLGVFAAYGLGAATVLVALSLSAAVAKAALVGGIRRLLPVVERVGGAVLVASGAYLVAYWLPALVGSTRRGGVTDGFSARLMEFLDGQQSALAAVAVTLAVAGVALALWLHRRQPSPAGTPEDDADCCAATSMTGEGIEAPMR
jgi:cytochrome c-type biogenesis protein